MSTSSYSSLSYSQPLPPKYICGLETPDPHLLGNGGDFREKTESSLIQNYLASKLPQADRKEVPRRAVLVTCGFFFAFSQLLISSSCPQVRSEFKKTLVLAAQKPKDARRKQPVRKSRRQLTAGERRKLGLARLPKRGLKYQSFIPLHTMWQQYMEELLDLGGLEAQGWSPNMNEEPRQQQLQTRLCRC